MSEPEFQWPRSTEAEVALVGRLSAWLERAGVTDPEHRATLAVGLGDTLASARRTADALERMLRQDPTTEAGAEQALEQTGMMSAWLFSEIQHHVGELAAIWDEQLVAPLAARGAAGCRRSVAAPSCLIEACC
jgi:hypothetical protein